MLSDKRNMGSMHCLNKNEKWGMGRAKDMQKYERGKRTVKWVEVGGGGGGAVEMLQQTLAIKFRKGH